MIEIRKVSFTHNFARRIFACRRHHCLASGLYSRTSYSFLTSRTSQISRYLTSLLFMFRHSLRIYAKLLLEKPKLFQTNMSRTNSPYNGPYQVDNASDLGYTHDGAEQSVYSIEDHTAPAQGLCAPELRNQSIDQRLLDPGFSQYENNPESSTTIRATPGRSAPL